MLLPLNLGTDLNLDLDSVSDPDLGPATPRRRLVGRQVEGHSGARPAQAPTRLAAVVVL